MLDLDLLFDNLGDFISFSNFIAFTADFSLVLEAFLDKAGFISLVLFFDLDFSLLLDFFSFTS